MATAIPRKLSLIKPDRQLFAAGDENALTKQVLATHSEEPLEFPVTPLLSLVEQIFLRAKLNAHQGTTRAQLEAIEDNSPSPADLLDLLDFVSFTINKVSNEIQYKCSGAGDPHTVTMEVFNLLSSWPWDAKVVLALAAFAINYGEFWLLVQQSSTDLLAKDISLLKKLPEIFERVDIVKQKFEALDKLIKALVDVAKCIVDFKMLPPHYITPDTPEMKSATTLIPTAIYWTIRSIVACAAQNAGLIGVGHEYLASASETWELSSLAHKIDNIRKHLEQLLLACHRYINEKMHHEAYMNLVRLFEIPHIDNNKILRALIYSKDDKPPLIDGLIKEKATLEVLRKKNVLLLISDLDLSVVELSMLDQIYRESRQNKTRTESDYEVVWMPIVDSPWTEEKQVKFDALLGLMPWYSVAHPSLIESAVIKYVRQVWNFIKKPLLVVLDPQGKVVNTNAVHMLWIWGSLAYPFTSAREESLWKEETWRLELLVDSVEPLIFQWMETGKYICILGGEDLGWIRSFSTKALEVAKDAEIALEILYVGKSNPGEKIKKNIAAILAEKIIHTLVDPTLIWFFWVRLESMWYSKTQRGNTIEEDPVMQETMTMLSFDSGDQGWALFCKGSTDILRAKAETITNVVSGYEERWKVHVKDEGFIPAMSKDLQDIHTPEHCNRLILPSSNGTIPEKVVCSECGSAMEKFIMYRCCND
ncbi:protein SIEVE ELEMENT OCCLUSION B-like [Benincasa hispida]|uniref:protein SIEVE ELEMENT OCCLUSION B-like n=1 Tax=Benincasa hispida TaxID=102211 RepID=UPI0018FF8C93|nr:protein SIEVE ELEMENT OCCLUSION B-like [Benincasa hispida]